MTDVQNSARKKLREQQGKVKEYSTQWMVAEQLIELCQREPESAALLDKDLDVKEMSIVEAEKNIKAFADKRKVGNSSCVSPMEAEDILREFYGLPKRGAAPEMEKTDGEIALDLSSFLG